MANVTGNPKASAGTAVQAALANQSAVRRSEGVKGEARKSSGYGLPCAKCHLYYPANLDTCPTCQHNERVSPVVPKVPQKAVQLAEEAVPDSAVVEQEREEFLRQFKAQLLEAHAEVANAPEAICKFGEHHTSEPGPAEICNVCYERLQERADVMEASLHIELKEAAQTIYDPAGSDPSDPSKTYQNAATALLAELRKRAGITAVLGPFQPLTH